MSFENGVDQSSENPESSHWDTLYKLANVNREFFSPHQDECGLRICTAHVVVLDIIKELRPLYKEIATIAPQYDFDENTPGNGYRSFISLVDKCILHCEGICQQIYNLRESVLFRKTNYMREIEACSQLMASLSTFLHHLKTLHTWSELGMDNRPSLFPSEEHSPQELLDQAGNIDQYCYYGRCLGFQFTDSIKYIMKVVLVSMASFSEAYYTNGSFFGRCANSLKYVVDPEARARRIVNIAQRGDVYFCKAFWYLHDTQIVQFVPFMMIPTLAINQVISIPPEQMSISSVNGGPDVHVPIPCSHVGKKPIHVKLWSSKRRIGMVGSARASGELHGPSDVLLFHCHGGGFVADSPKAHETYLRNWVVALDVPIISVDYSLSPEAPYPRALEELVYTYAWALKHANSLLGTNAKKVILIGDSAGANLNLGLTAKCLELNIRKPDGIFMVYCPVLVEFVPSPSRMLGLTDPLLPFGFMMRCLRAYVLGDSSLDKKDKDNGSGEYSKSDTESFAEVSESDLIAIALSPHGDKADESQLASLPSDSTLNSVSLAEVDNTQGAEITKSEDKSETTSQEYIRKFLDLYKNVSFKKSTTSMADQSANDFDNSDGKGTSSFLGFPFGRSGSSVRELDTACTKSPTDEFVFTVPKDPYLSPYRHSDEVLSQLPPCKIVTSDLDPCLDDCVMFGRKLRALGNHVSLDIVTGLPHGFLNLAVVSKEAADASELCMKRIKELIDM
ncbi:hormone-sensitive lipase [Diachasma alloeum]|uniref:hormone-sensitive lipase n=1 Tax=Diachasma alloeum TaxID=454923 RepID=UPI0007384DC5|nr:hormone-sensitive lipase [Diachasma alloeum]